MSMSLEKYDQAIVDAVTDLFGPRTQLLDRANAPGLWGAAHELGCKAGVRARIFVVDTALPQHRNAISAHMPNAMGGPMLLPGDGNVFLTENFLKYGNISLHSPPEPWVKAVLAHEMGHIKQGLLNMASTRMWPTVGVTAGVAALWLYEKFFNHHGKEKIEKLGNEEHKKAFDDFADKTIAEQKRLEEKARSGDIEAQVKVSSGHDSASMAMAKYMAAAALGLGAGLLATRLHMRHLEFDADRFAVLVTRDPKACADIFPKLRAMFKQAKAELPPGLKGHTWTERFMHEFTHYHPGDKERIENIKRVGQELGLDVSSIGKQAQKSAAVLTSGFADTLKNERVAQQLLGLTIPHH